MTWKSLFFLFLLLLLDTSADDECLQYILSSSTSSSLGLVDGKCLAITKSGYTGSSTTSCKSVGKSGYVYTQLSIDNKPENDFVKDGLLENDVTSAYIGLVQTSTGWGWMNSQSSLYRNWAIPPVTVPPTPAATTSPFRSTLPPAKQRRSTAIVIGIDASLYSTNSLTFAQVDFARSLAHYIGDRGPAEFAIFAYGCTQLSPYTAQYPYFARTFEDTDKMIENLNETIIHDCVRSSPLDYKSMFRDQTVYYNRYSTSYRPFKSGFISMIYFSSSTNSTNIRATGALYPIANSSVIQINVGSASADVSPLAIPAFKNFFRVNSTDDILGLVPKVDAMIFGTTPPTSGSNVQSGGYQEPEPSIDAASDYTDCAYMNSTDGLWYSDGACSTKLPVLCQYVLPTPEPPPTPNPTLAWQDPCYKESTNFTYFQILNNAKCYRVSSEKKQFAEAENVCLSDHPLFLHTPKLASIETSDEEEQLRTLISSLDNEGMFWFGLKRDPSNSSNWYFINGDTYDASYQNWRAGYPRDADGCDCVAMVYNDGSWVNTDCNKQLYSICSYRFNSSDKAF